MLSEPRTSAIGEELQAAVLGALVPRATRGRRARARWKGVETTTGPLTWNGGTSSGQHRSLRDYCRRRTCEFSQGTVGSAGTRQPAAAARRSQPAAARAPRMTPGCTSGHASAPATRKPYGARFTPLRSANWATSAQRHREADRRRHSINRKEVCQRGAARTVCHAASDTDRARPRSARVSAQDVEQEARGEV